jgi:(p)ppGpp synthase/HD superfamily hydrolase
MTERAAQTIAKTAHEAQRTSAVGSLLDHVQRVAAAVPEYARATASLHDVVERTDLTIGQLRAQGLSPVEFRAIALLTRTEEDDYRAYVRRIAHASGQHALARVVKLADLDDHLAHPRAASQSTPPYGWARAQS